MAYDKQEAAAENELYDHRLQCPNCKRLIDSLPAESVPDQDLRGCPYCGAVFFE